MKQLRFHKGFTLIEAMIVVAIVGILASIAVPQYQNYLQTTGRGDAYKALGRMLDKQEHYVNRNNAASYTTDVSLVGGEDTEHGYYKISVISADSKEVVLQAKAVVGGPQENDMEGSVDCSTLTISSTGARTPPECWVKQFLW